MERILLSIWFLVIFYEGMKLFNPFVRRMETHPKGDTHAVLAYLRLLKRKVNKWTLYEEMNKAVIQADSDKTEGIVRTSIKKNLSRYRNDVLQGVIYLVGTIVFEFMYGFAMIGSLFYENLRLLGTSLIFLSLFHAMARNNKWYGKTYLTLDSIATIVVVGFFLARPFLSN